MSHVMFDVICAIMLLAAFLGAFAGMRDYSWLPGNKRKYGGDFRLLGNDWIGMAYLTHELHLTLAEAKQGWRVDGDYIFKPDFSMNGIQHGHAIGFITDGKLRVIITCGTQIMRLTANVGKLKTWWDNHYIELTDIAIEGLPIGGEMTPRGLFEPTTAETEETLLSML